MSTSGPTDAGESDRLRGAQTTTPRTTGPRFDVRFEPDGALLELAKPLRASPVELEQLSLSLGRLRFPLAVGGGAARFRTRRTVLRRVRLRVELRGLAALCSALGVALRFHGVTREGALRCSVSDVYGALAFEATLLADGADLAVVLRAARSAVDGPTPALTRVLAVLSTLGVSLDPASGLLRLRRVWRVALRELMAGHGWRVPDDRAARLAPPVLDERSVVLLGATDSANADPRELSLREDARALAPVLEALEAGEVDTARARLVRALARAGTAGDARALRELSAALAFEVADPRATFEVASLVAPEDDVAAASLAASLALRAALRAGDADAAASAARRVDALEASGTFAAAALRAAAHAFDAAHAGARAELLARAVARAPEDATTASDAVAASVAARDVEGAERSARRVLAALPNAADRAQVLRAAALAAPDDHVAAALSSLWDDGLALAPDDSALLLAAARARVASGDAVGALTLLDRAGAAALSASDAPGAARLLARAAQLAASLGRDDGAADRLARAAQLDPDDASLLASLAATYERLGAVDDAATTYARLLARGASLAHLDALLAATRLHLAHTNLSEARAFLDASRRVSPDHPALAELTRALDAAVADGWTSSPGTLGAIDVFALSGVARDASDPAALVRAIITSLEAPASPSDVPALVAAAQTAAARLTAPGTRELGARLADVVAAASAHVVDPSDLTALEALASTDETRAVLAARAAQLLRGAGQTGAAARALARAGVVRRDAATLRAAIDLAVRAEAWDDAISIVHEALEIVGDGPARAQLVARAALIAEKRR